MTRIVTDKYKYQHELTSPLSSGGQGTVWRTKDPKIAVKIAGRENISRDEQEKLSEDMHSSLERLSLLPIPENIGISLPIAPLENLPGYSMRMLGGGMKSFEEAFSVIQSESEIDSSEIPNALKNWPEGLAKRFVMYSRTGGLRRRLLSLSKCAAELSRLNGAGLIYCDVNMNNIFVSDDANNPAVWLIDADNIRFDGSKGNTLIFPGFGSPEIYRGKSGNTSQGDCWAFSVSAFKSIFMWEHPFEGALINDYDDLDEAELAAYSGEFPYALDPDDDSNGNYARNIESLMLTPELDGLFLRTFTDGKDDPFSRPPIFLWPEALAQAADLTVLCPECGNHYYDSDSCSWCGSVKPKVITAQTRNENGREIWRFVREIFPGKSLMIPRRVFAPFTMRDFDTEIFTLTQSENGILMTRPDLWENISLSAKGSAYKPAGFRENIPFRKFSVKANIAGREVIAEFSLS